MLNKVRKQYARILNRPQTMKDKRRVMRTGTNLENMLKTPGWKSVAKFMEEQKSGAHEVLERSTGSINLITLPLFFNSFLKYFFVILEIRAYKKIENYIRITIQRGNEYAEQERKREERKARQQSKS